MSLKAQLLGQVQGGLIGYHVFESSGTYNKNPLARNVKVTVVGGGGSGGSRASASNLSVVREAGGGGGAGASIKFISNTDIGSTETITIGVGGVEATGGNDGNSGGTSSFGTHCSATGGGGGVHAPNSDTSIQLGGIRGIGVGGDLNLSGGRGGTGQTISTPAGNRPSLSNYGGSSPISPAHRVRETTNNGTGGSPAGYGVGSAGVRARTSALESSSLSGTSGVVIVEEYA